MKNSNWYTRGIVNEQLGGVSQAWIFVPITVAVLLATAVHYLVEFPVGNGLLNLKEKLVQKVLEKRKANE